MLGVQIVDYPVFGCPLTEVNNWPPIGYSIFLITPNQQRDLPIHPQQPQ